MRNWVSSLDWRQASTLQRALTFSVVVHALLLLLQAPSPMELSRVFEDNPLEVVLVNARSQDAPLKAQARAQANLAGGGDASQGMASSPVPTALEADSGDALEASNTRIERMLREQQALLTALLDQSVRQRQRNEGRSPDSPEEASLEAQRQRIAKQLAQIDQRVKEENARPRRRYVSPATQEAVYALYYDALRRRVEERGTRDYPEINGEKLYGELTVNLVVDASGSLLDARIVVPSSSRLLDQRALAIVRAASPFGPFTRAMKRDADQIVVTSRFRFTREAGLSASLGAPP